MKFAPMVFATVIIVIVFVRFSSSADSRVGSSTARDHVYRFHPLVARRRPYRYSGVVQVFVGWQSWGKSTPEATWMAFCPMDQVFVRTVPPLVAHSSQVGARAAAVATGLAVWIGSTFGTSFLPEFNEGTFTVFLMAPPGTSLQGK
jgi:multidrug efflux pump subunit AcrB